MGRANHTVLELDPLISFTKLAGRLADTERFLSLRDKKRPENVSEHCTQLALTAWFLVEKYDLPLDREKILKYALIHDFPEVNTGDFPTHKRSCDRIEKRRLEREALTSLKSEYPDAEKLWSVYDEYDRCDNEEGKFVYALDKLLPAMNIYLDSCEEWREREPDDLAWYVEDLMQRMKPSPIILKFWKGLLARINNEYPSVFQADQLRK